MNDDRPKWLRGTLAVLTGWISFWICLVLFLVVTISITDLIVPGDGLPMLPGIIMAVISLILSITVTIKLVKLQDRFMSRFTRRANYIVLAILLLASVLIIPAPFSYTEF